MAEKLHFNLVSPEQELMSEDVEMVVVPGSEGDFGVLVEHAPFMSTLRPGIIQVFRAANDSPMNIFVRGGFAEVTPAGLTILASDAQPLEQVERADLEERIAEAKEDVELARSDEERQAADLHLSDLEYLHEMLDEFKKG